MTAVHTVKIKGKISQNFVAFSEYMNFTSSTSLTDTELYLRDYFRGILDYRNSSYSFTGNYSFFNLEIQRSYIRPKVKVHKCAETIQERKLFRDGNCMRKYDRLSMYIRILSKSKGPKWLPKLFTHNCSRFLLYFWQYTFKNKSFITISWYQIKYNVL